MNSPLLKLVPALVLFAGCLPLSAAAQGLELVTVSPSQDSPDGGDGDSNLPLLSPDGRFVLFASTADNLVTLENGQTLPPLLPPRLNVFLRDRASHTTALVSIDLIGAGGADANATPMGLSADGRFALFESAADNLVAGDTNHAPDVFVRDRVEGKTLLISRAANGGVANGASQWSAITPDGRYVVFVSDGTNLVPDDTNGIPDVFVHDLETRSTVLVSVGATSGKPGHLLALENPPAITPDGRYVLFHSTASNLVDGVTTTDDIYVRDLQLGLTVQASAGALAAVRTNLGASDFITLNYSISTNGQYVIYEACPSFGLAGLVLRYSLETGQTELIYTNASAGDIGVGSLDITPDGETIAFVANANGTPGDATCVLVWNEAKGSSVLASGDPTNGVAAGTSCLWPTLDASGRYVCFLSSATGLVTNALPGEFHLYVRDLQAGTTTLVDADPNGTGSLLTSLPVPSLSSDGRFVAFECADSDLVPNDFNRAYDVFTRDLATRQNELVSVALPSTTPNGESSLSEPPISADGGRVAFWSEASNLVLDDTNGVRDVFVRDLATNQFLLVSVGTNGQVADGVSTAPAISADGRYVAFLSSADNLVPGDSNNNQDVFVRDLQTATTFLVSMNRDGTGSGNGSSFSPVISADGRYVLFHSQASDLVSGSFANENLFLWDRQTLTNYALTRTGVAAAAMTPDGRFIAFAASPPFQPPGLFVWDTENATSVYTNDLGGILNLGISPDGRRLLYGTANGLFGIDRLANTNWTLATTTPSSSLQARFSADSLLIAYTATVGGTNQVFLYDCETGGTLLVSRQWGLGGPGNGHSDSPDISADGRFVAFRSLGDNLVPNDRNGVPDIFLFDRLSGSMTLVSANRFGTGSGNNRSLKPTFSPDGRTLYFVSWASDLVDGDFNAESDIFAYSIYSNQALTEFKTTSTQDKDTCQIQWSVLPGKSYRVQFKNALTDTAWQDLTANVAIIGNRGYFTDPTPAGAQRFYRVVAY